MNKIGTAGIDSSPSRDFRHARTSMTSWQRHDREVSYRAMTVMHAQRAMTATSMWTAGVHRWALPSCVVVPLSVVGRRACGPGSVAAGRPGW